MKVSAFTFIKNGQILGYPFLQSIKSILPIVDEFIINVGESEDDTLDMIHSIKDKKVRIIESKWNDEMRDQGYVYGQQKMIAQFNCTGDWAFYRKDCLNINGFNNEFEGWGREDSEFVVRLINSGVKRKNVRFNAIQFHLWHNENSRISLEKNNAMLEDAINNRIQWCENGINSLEKNES